MAHDLADGDQHHHAVNEHVVIFVDPSARSLVELREKARAFVRPRSSLEACCDLLQSLDETVTNAIVHGGGHRVIVHVGLSHDRVTATVRDGGKGFDVQRLVRKWPPEADGESGRGIYMATRLMDSLAILADRGTIVHMSRALAGDGVRGAPVCVWTSPALVAFAREDRSLAL